MSSASYMLLPMYMSYMIGGVMGSVLRDARHSHGTVAVARKSAAEGAEWSQKRLFLELPNIGVKHSNTPKPISDRSPDSVANVLNYKIVNPTPLPATFDGVYCRGGACQYRVTPPPQAGAFQIATAPPLPLGGNELSGKEFCKGLGCISGMGQPGSPPLSRFKVNCLHLYQDVLGGMYGTDLARTVADVRESFLGVCGKRVGPLEAAACPSYADAWVAAVSPKVNNPTVGNAEEVCTDTFWWISAFKQAELDLKLFKAALPKGSGSSLLAAAWNRFGSGGVGPNSPRGLEWRDYAKEHKLEKTWSADTPEKTLRGLPKYIQNPPIELKSNISQKDRKYQIAAASPDGMTPPVEIDADLFEHCANQFSEIMLGFSQTAKHTVQMTKDWCSWQASVTSWIGKKDEYGHPDWDHRTCSNMETFMTFVFKDNLSEFETGFSAQQVCKKVFLAIGVVHRNGGIVNDAWSNSMRPPPIEGGIPAPDDPEMQRLLHNSQEQANAIFSKLRGQVLAYESLRNAKMDTIALDSNTM